MEDPILAVIKLVLKTCPAATLTLRADSETVLLEIRFMRQDADAQRLLETIDLKLKSAGIPADRIVRRKDA